MTRKQLEKLLEGCSPWMKVMAMNMLEKYFAPAPPVCKPYVGRRVKDLITYISLN